MQRHFSNRGEPLAEVTAARMLAGRRGSKAGFTGQPGRRVIRQTWFSERVEKPRAAKKPHVAPSSEETAILF